jgi:hypothetical protein
VPLFLRRVNAVYAALAIEQNLPSLKNSLVNLLLLRSSEAGASAAVIEAVEAQAATRLSHVDAEVHVDRSRLIRLGYILLGVMAFAALYGFLSPKDPLQTFRRVFAPWSAVAAPTRVQISRVTPGDAEIFRDGQVPIEVMVHNLKDQPVELFYSSLDEQRRINNRRLELKQRSPGVFETLLPGGIDGLQESVTYFVRAGDAESPVYNVTVLTPPAISVKQVEYKYPAYTGRERAPTTGGDIQALEGTEVTLLAESNQDIKEAWLDLNCDGRTDLRMSTNGRTATVRFTLRMNSQPGEGRRGEHDSYQIRFVNTDLHENPHPIRYKINTIPDDPPQVAIVQPEQRQVEVPANGSLPLQVWAADPDFALSRVRLVAERESASGRLLFDLPLLEQEHRGEFKTEVTLVPGEHQLQPGEVVLVRGIAFDNKQPQPNVSKSDSLRIKIVAPAERDPNQPMDQQRPEQKPDQKPQDDPRQQPKQPGDQPQNQQGQPQDKEQQGNQPGGDPQQANDKNQQPGQKDPKQQQPGDNGQQEGMPQQGNPGEQGQPDPGAEPKENGQPGDQPMRKPGEGQQGDPSQDGQQPGDQPQQPGQEDRSQQPRQGDQQQQGEGSQNGQQRSQEEPLDPQKDPGKVIEELLKHREQQDQQAGQQPPQDQQGGAGNQNQNQQQQQNPGNQGNQKQPGGPQNQGDRNQPGGDNQQSSPSGGDPQSQNGSGKNGMNEPSSEGQSPSGDQPGAGEKPMDPRGGATQKGGGDQQGGGQQRADQQGDNAPAGGGEKPENAQPGQGKKPGDAQSQESKDTPDGDPKPSQDENGMGGATKPNTENNMNDPAQGESQSSQKGGDDTMEKGAGGAGSPEGGDKGSPNPKEAAKPKMGKEQNQGENQTPNDPNGAQTQSESNHESDSQGDSSGDRAGGGKDGGGQNANQKGTGGAGQNTAADEGASKAPGSGKGEDSSEAGNKTEADGQTGVSGDRAGQGSQTREGETASGAGKSGGEGQTEPQQQQPRGQAMNDGQGESPQPGQQQGERPNGQQQPMPNGEQPGGSTDQRNQSQPGAEQAQSDRSGSGQPGQNNSGAPESVGQGTGGLDNSAKPPQDASKDFRGEDPNLEYANRATDLALKHLRDELSKENPDPELLNRIRMSRDEAREFLDRMQQNLVQSQQQGTEGEVARNRLRNLGLRPSSGGNQNDALRDLRESTITRPPMEYRDEYRSYTERGVRPSRNK